MLNIINESGDIIGEETRENIHRKGLLHKEIHVWFYTPKGGIIFQHRAKDKDTYPNLLDATVGGHIEIGEDDLTAALKEMREETGIKGKAEDLTFLTTTQTKMFDPATGMTNHARRKIFAFKYEGKIDDLKIEENKALGFEVWPIDNLLNISEEDKKKFVPSISINQSEVFRKLKNIIFNKNN